MFWPGGNDPGAARRIILHVDMDAFYASVELRRRPDLIGAPMIVGDAQRGVVLSATYEARAHGVRGGMPMARARRLCPQAEIITPDFEAYEEASRGVFAILDGLLATVERASIDEAFCDITGARGRLGTPRDIGELIRARVVDEQQITCTVGIGPTKFVAKLASNAAKPDGLREVPPADVVGFLHPLPVEAMWGVGETTAERLHGLGLHTIADLAHLPVATLQRAFGPHQGRLLHDLAWGHDPRPVVGHVAERSVGSEQTFGRDTDDPEVIRRELLRLADRTATRLRASGVMGRTVQLTVRFADFRQITRSATLPGPTDETGAIHAQAVALWEKLALQRPRVRKLGVRITGLVDLDQAHWQPSLDEPDRGWREAERVADELVRRFGPHAVRRASLTRR